MTVFFAAMWTSRAHLANSIPRIIQLEQQWISYHDTVEDLAARPCYAQRWLGGCIEKGIQVTAKVFAC